MGKKECCEKNPFVAISASTLGIFLVVAILWMVLASSQLSLLIPIAWAFVVLGGLGMFFAYLSARKKK